MTGECAFVSELIALRDNYELCHLVVVIVVVVVVVVVVVEFIIASIINLHKMCGKKEQYPLKNQKLPKVQPNTIKPYLSAFARGLTVW